MARSPVAPPELAEEELRRLALQIRETVIDLGKEPPIRIWLVRVGPKDYAMFVSLHHLVGDGISLEILLQELQILYEAQAKGETAELPGLEITYGDFALWQRTAIRKTVL